MAGFASVGSPVYATSDGYSITDIYEHNDEFHLTRNNLVKTIPSLYKQWKISFCICPEAVSTGWTSIIHLGIGGDNANYGDRSPGVFFTPGTTQLHIRSAINGDRNYSSYGDTPAIPLFNWTTIEVSQIKRGDSYKFAIRIDDKVFHEMTNSDARKFEDVKLYASDNFYQPANANIKYLSFRNIL